MEKDYLEPVTHNVTQNSEYFGERYPRSVPSIIVMDDKLDFIDKAEKSAYYNDNIMNVLGIRA